MAWRALDPRLQREFVMVMPRTQPTLKAQMQQWETAQRRASRLQHPGLAPMIEVGQVQGWPYVVYEHEDAAILSSRPEGIPPAARDAAETIRDLGEALAFAHQSGLVHGDPQAFLVLEPAAGSARWLGLSVALELNDPSAVDALASHSSASLDESDRLRRQREVAQRDVLGLGLLLYRALTAQLPLEEADTGRVIARLPPLGRDIVRLPWSTPRTVPDALRAIANRATDRQERQRYRSARTLVQALDGWLKTDDSVEGSALVLLRDRLTTVGVLPASPGSTERSARILKMERKRTAELAEVVMQDIALTFELIKAANAPQAKSGPLADPGPVLTIRRAIAMVGLDGVRRASSALRPWPGAVPARAVADLQALMQEAHWAARLAQALRPAGWDLEMVALVSLLQYLGPLLIQYHFPDEALQISKLMLAAPPASPGAGEEPGMTEQAAAFAVLGVDVETIGCAVARLWGLDDSAAQLMRRFPRDTAVHASETDDGILRALASCAHEGLAANRLPGSKRQAALSQVVKRYGRVLDLTQQRLDDALAASRTPPTANPQAEGPRTRK